MYRDYRKSVQIEKTRLRPEVKIQNVVCTADLKQKINIASFNKYKFLSSNLDLYLCGYVKDDTMVGRVTVFASGKLISVGTKSSKMAHDELKKAVIILQKYKLAKKFRITPIVRNIVARCDLVGLLPLEKLARILPRSMYEPEIFPGIIYRLGGSVVALIFASGKCVIVGTKSVEELNTAYFELEKRTVNH